MINQITKRIMCTKNLEILPLEELALIKGGIWVYDSEANEWYWYEPNDLDIEGTTTNNPQIWITRK